MPFNRLQMRMFSVFGMASRDGSYVYCVRHPYMIEFSRNPNNSCNAIIFHQNSLKKFSDVKRRVIKIQQNLTNCKENISLCALTYESWINSETQLENFQILFTICRNCNIYMCFEWLKTAWSSDLLSVVFIGWTNPSGKKNNVFSFIWKVKYSKNWQNG